MIPIDSGTTEVHTNQGIPIDGFLSKADSRRFWINSLSNVSRDCRYWSVEPMALFSYWVTLNTIQRHEWQVARFREWPDVSR